MSFRFDPAARPFFACGSAHFWAAGALVVAAFGLLSCDTRPYGGAVMVPVSNAEPGPPGACTSLGPIAGESTGRRFPRQRAELVATDLLRDAAASRGANYVRVERFSWDAAGSKGWRGSAHGTAFRCAVEPRREVVCRREERLSTCSLR
jgi:hypothetical protein